MGFLTIIQLIQDFFTMVTNYIYNKITLRFTNDHEYVSKYNNVSLKTPYLHIVPFFQAIHESPKYRNYIHSFLDQTDIVLKSFTVTDINLIKYNNIGFIKGYAEAYDVNTDCLIESNSISFIQGIKDAIFFVIHVNCKKYILLVKHYCIPSGGKRVEAITCIMDNMTGEFKGEILTELEKLIEHKIKVSDLNLFRLQGSLCWTTPSTCDETIREWLYEFTMSETKYLEMSNNNTNNTNIQFLFYDSNNFEETLNEIGDYKASNMWRKYKNK